MPNTRPRNLPAAPVKKGDKVLIKDEYLRYRAGIGPNTTVIVRTVNRKTKSITTWDLNDNSLLVYWDQLVIKKLIKRNLPEWF